MTVSRRKMLSLVGGGAVLAVAVPAIGFLTTRTPTEALKPWDLAGQYEDPRMNAMSYALLAPNPHNRQPWEAALIGDDRVAIYRDKNRNLPVTDPFDRQLTIGMGCFLELMDMAAAQKGFAVQTELFPQGEDGPVAMCTFTSGNAAPNPLFEHVLLRRSHKEMFDEKPVTTEAAASLNTHADLYLNGDDRDTLRRIAVDAWLAEVNTPNAWKESIDLLRIGKTEINASPDGIDVGGPLMDSLALVGVLNREDALDITNPNAKAPIDDTTAAINSAPALTLTRTKGNSRIEQIDAGRRWLRLNLAATGAGLALRPVSQALQEYPGVKQQFDEIHSKFAGEGETLQMLGLLGYGERVDRSPRWPLEKRMKNA